MIAVLKEIADRVRRIETRLTKYLEVRGFDTQTQRPSWHDGVIYIPSSDCSIKDCLSAVPADWDKDQEIEVRHRSKLAMSFYLPVEE
ncbi:MAG: hypothetical protein ACREDM_08520 [Methylocella sp.]